MIKINPPLEPVALVNGVVHLALDGAYSGYTVLVREVWCTRCGQPEQRCPCRAWGQSRAIVRIMDRRCYG